MTTQLARQTTTTDAAVRHVEAAKPFLTLKQVQEMDRGELEALALSLQTRTLERRTVEGTMVCVQRIVPLVYGASEDIYEVPRVGAMINAKGYRKIAAYAGVKFFTPDSINIDGEVRSNPYIERDPVTRSNKRCFVRKVAVWRGPLGEPVARDLTLVYDPGALFLVALRGKMGSNPADIRTEARRLGDPCEPGWQFFPEMDMPGSEGMYVGLYAKLSNPDVGACIKDRLDKSKFIERYADTFCERNLTKKMLNVNVPRVVNGSAAVPVMAWVAPSDEAFVTRALEGMRGIRDPDNVVATLEAQGTVVLAELDDSGDDAEIAEDRSADDDDAVPNAERSYDLDTRRAVLAEHRDATPPAPPVEPVHEPAASTPTKADAIGALMQRLDTARKTIGDGAYRACCESVGVDPAKPGAKGSRALEALVAECEDTAR